MLRSIAITESLFDLVKRREYKITDLVIEDQYVRKNAKSALVLSRLVGML